MERVLRSFQTRGTVCEHFPGKGGMGAFVNLTPPEAILSKSSCTFGSEKHDSLRRLDLALPSRKRCSRPPLVGQGLQNKPQTGFQPP